MLTTLNITERFFGEFRHLKYRKLVNVKEAYDELLFRFFG